MEVNQSDTLVWRAEALSWRHGSNVTLNIKGTNKMALVFVHDYIVRGHPERMAQFVDQLLDEVKK